MNRSSTLLFIVRSACLLTLLGYAMMHFTWNGRLISQIYSEGFIDLGVRLFGFNWSGFRASDAVNPNYQLFIYLTGSVFGMGGLLALLPIPQQGIRKVIPLKILYYSCSSLILLSALSGIIESKLHLNVLIEYSVKITVSLLLLYYIIGRSFDPEKHVRRLKWVIALTFIGHGLYALNIFPVPADFTMMTSNILHMGRDGTVMFLAIAGVLDVLFSMLLFYRKTERIALVYMVIWGFLTALARLIAYHGIADTSTYLAMWIPEFLIRSGHFLVPLYLLVYIKRRTP